MNKLDKKILEEKIDARMREDINSGKVGGAALLVRQDGEILYKKCSGETACNSGIPVQENTMFRLASMTKPITTVAALIQIERGAIALDDTVAKYLPDFAEFDIGKINSDGEVEKIKKAEKQIRIIDLLNHSSGLGSMSIWEAQYRKMSPNDMLDLKNAVEYFSHTDLAFEPTTGDDYSPVAAFDTLARIIEITSGTTFDKFLQKEVFEPLGMKDTTFEPTEEQWSRMIEMHDYVDGKAAPAVFGKRNIFQKFPTTYFCGGAGLASTLGDYDKFAQMLLNYGRAGDKQIVSPELIEKMKTPNIVNPDSYDKWGLGVRVVCDNTPYTPLPAGSFGWSGAYGTHFWVDHKNKITAIYMKNSKYDGGAGSVTGTNFEKDVYSSFAN